MATPSVFVSSTCFDLSEIRDSLRRFILNYGFNTVLSDYGDIFFHPDLHTHEACIQEISNCQIFVLIIGGRFGGRYISAKDKSITNAEYEAAVEQKIPIFTYIKKSVLDNHQLYQDNKNKSFINEIEFPAINNQTDAISIFEFINRVKKASVNNGYESFEIAKEIEDHLKKQWAGMFFEYLRTREFKEQFKTTNQLLLALNSSSDKLEAIVKNIYQNVDKDHFIENMKKIEIEARAKFFIDNTFEKLCPGGVYLASTQIKENMLSIEPSTYQWYEYLIAIGLMCIYSDTEEEFMILKNDEYLRHEYCNIEEGDIAISGWGIQKKSTNQFQQSVKDSFDNGFKYLNLQDRIKYLSPHLHVALGNETKPKDSST